MEKKDTKQVRYSGTISKELADGLKELAKKNERSVNSLMKIIIKEYLDRENEK